MILSTRTVKGLYFGRMSFRESYVEIDHFSIGGGLDVPRLDGFFSNPLLAGAARTRVFGKLFGVFFVQCNDEDSTEFPIGYRRWWELMVFLLHEETDLLINFAFEDYPDIRYAILSFFEWQCPSYDSPAQDKNYISLIHEVHAVLTFMANPTKEGLQVMFITLTVYKYNINNGFIVPLLDDYMPRTSLAKSYSNPTGNKPEIIHEVYTKHSPSCGHQSLVLLRVNSDSTALSMASEEESMARIIFNSFLTWDAQQLPKRRLNQVVSNPKL